MLVTENEIRRIIRQSLLEAKTKGREDYEKMLEPSKAKIKSEIDKIDFVSDPGKEKLKRIIDNIQLIIIKEEKGGARNTKAYALYVKVDDQGNPTSDKFTKGSELIDDQSQDALDTWRSKSLTNPRIVINQKVFSLAGDKNTIDHEVRHIKNTALKFLLGTNKLNANEIKNILRKDFENMSDEKIIDKWIEEKRFPDNDIERRNAQGLINAMLNDYKNALKGMDKPVDEFAVRAAALKENPLIMATHQGKSYQEISSKYGADIAQIIPFLRYDLTWDDFKGIAKAKQKDVQTFIA